MGKAREGAQPFCHRASFVRRKQRELARDAKRQDTSQRWLLRVASIGGAEQDRRVHSEPSIAHPAAEARERWGKAVHLVDDNNARTCRPCQQDGFGLAKQGDVAPGEVGDVRTRIHACAYTASCRTAAHSIRGTVLVLKALT